MLDFDVCIRKEHLEFEYRAKIPLDSAWGVVGPSGCGKTTFLNMIAGLEKPNFGTVSLKDRLLFDHASKTHVEPHKRRIGVVFQHNMLFPHLTVKQNLSYGMKLKGDAGGLELLNIAKLLGISHLLDRSVTKISGGEQKRTAIARAVLYMPDLLLLDEPFTGLDSETRGRTIACIQNLRRQRDIPLFIVSHEIMDILCFTENIIKIEDRKIVYTGNVYDVEASTLGGSDIGSLVNVVHANLCCHHPNKGLSVAKVDESSLLPYYYNSPQINVSYLSQVPVGSQVSFKLMPKDIALSLNLIENISIQNQLYGKIENIIRYNGVCLCVIDVGIRLFAIVSNQTAIELGLYDREGVYVLFKSCAMNLISSSATMKSRRSSQIFH